MVSVNTYPTKDTSLQPHSSFDDAKARSVENPTEDSDAASTASTQNVILSPSLSASTSCTDTAAITTSPVNSTLDTIHPTIVSPIKTKFNPNLMNQATEHSPRRFFSLPDPPFGLVSPITPSTNLSRSFSSRFALSESDRILSGGSITQIYNCRVLRDHMIEYDDIWFQDSRIINPTYLYGLRGPDIRIDGKGLIATPGLIDVQLNGAFGYDFSFNKENIGECFDTISRGILLQGCTSFCPTTVSSMPETYHDVLPHIGHRIGSLEHGAESLGAHVEGPFMNPDKKGAHELSCLRAAPNGLADFEYCFGLENLKKHVAYITVAPEVDGVIDSIPHLITECDIRVSLGHSVATNDTARKAHKNGSTMITHLFNAMTDFHHRDPGIIGLLGSASDMQSESKDFNNIGVKADMENPVRYEPNTTNNNTKDIISDVFYGIICDGIHVHPNTIKIAYNSHPTGAILVSDAMGAMGLPDGEYKLGNMDVEVKSKPDFKNGQRAAFIKGTDTLAGSIVTLIDCVRNFKEYTQCSMVEAIEAASLHPAQMLGIQNRKGTLAFGADADILLITDDLNIERIFVRGQLATPDSIDFNLP